MQASTHSSDKLRRIAILVASVEPATARQLLLHLPTAIAKQVRHLANSLTHIEPSERQQVIAEFQRSTSAASSVTSVSHSLGNTESAEPMRLTPPKPVSLETMPTHVETSGIRERVVQSKEFESSSSYDVEALKRFAREERPPVIAVVISQLPPQVAVQVLQCLPAETCQDVLARLKHLQDIDPEAFQAIEQHIEVRLQEMAHRLKQESQNSQRLQAILSAAPEDLRKIWGSVMELELVEPNKTATQRQVTKPIEISQEVDSQSAPQAASIPKVAAKQVVPMGVSPEPGDTEAGPPTESADAAHIIPFPKSDRNEWTHIDRSLLQLQFEGLLDLPPALLAGLMSHVSSDLVLLALAGASKTFMTRFTAMLEKRDAKVLSARLQTIGALKLSDIDEAQRRIIELADKLMKSRRDKARRMPTNTSLRAA
ncbi:MAG: hypothetical protein KDB03_13295 [Planctomycetales bacterium]|nr:hypothetical protein [Planctomycetales bacterium]